MNKPITIENERSVVLEQLSEITTEELCSELKDRDIEDEILIELLDIDMPEPEEPPEPDPIISSSETTALYDAIAEGRTKDALEIVFNLYPSNLLHPTAQMRVAALRP